MRGIAGSLITSSLPAVWHSSSISIAGHVFLLFFPLSHRKKYTYILHIKLVIPSAVLKGQMQPTTQPN